MAVLDGPTLRTLREQHRVPLREVARLAGRSHGHLSKVERGEPGRLVTSAVLAAYQQATGVALSDGEASDDRGGWRPGQLDDHARRAFTGKVAAVAWLPPVEDRLDRLIAHRCRLPPPRTVDAPQVGQLAQVAAGTGVEAGSHAAARTLQLVAVHTATLADAPDLRAHVIADIAVHLHLLGHRSDSQAMVRLGEIDADLFRGVNRWLGVLKAGGAYERITDQTRGLPCEVKTQAADAEHPGGNGGS